MARLARSFRVAALALCLLGAGGCAAYHSVPPAHFSAVGAASGQPSEASPIVRVVFDQQGNIYPPSPNDIGLAAPPQPPNWNRAFTLPVFYARQRQSYDPAAITNVYATEIARLLREHRTNRIVFLIKGFNNSYEASRREFEFVRNRIRDLGPDGPFLFVELYWDSLYKGPRTFPIPGAYWFDSLTYSNFAGQVGLRRLLNMLPDGLDLTFLTHSRGAAVAISALSNPAYDAGISQPPPVELAEGKVARGTIVAFAPAIGNGHVEQPDLLRHIDRIYIGFNPRDWATRKLVGVPARLGDTRLNASDRYYRATEARLNAQGATVLEREILDDSASHDWEDYFANEEPARCLLWAARLVRQRPEQCAVTR